MPPSIEEIPTAAQLQQQFELLNQAIAGLAAGSTITNLTVSAPTPPEGGTFTMPIPIILDPAIDDPASIAAVSTQLQAQADALEDQLVQMGYAPPANSTLSTRR